MEQINKYENGKIYKLVDKTNDNKVIYIGSTTQKLIRRINQHKQKSRDKPDRKIYKYICNVGWDNIDIELIENYKCDSKTELELRERYYIELLKPDLNHVIPTRKAKEYYNENRDKIMDNKRKYYENNKDKISDYHKDYYKNNDNIKIQNKEYYSINKNKILEKMKEKCICECGSEIIKCKKSRHEKSKKHMTYINNLNGINL